jgi:hypothetical protein
MVNIDWKLKVSIEKLFNGVLHQKISDGYIFNGEEL